MTSKDYDGYSIVRKEALDTINQSSSAYDKAVITLSSLLLGYIFIYSAQFNVKITPCVIKLIFGSISLSLVSFWLDQLVASSSIKIAEEYYINSKEDFKSKMPKLYYPALIIKMLAGILYLFGFIYFYLAIK